MALENKKQVSNKINYILGVDGGGTKTLARLINLTTQEQWQAASGPSSLTNNFTGAVKVLNALIDDLIEQADCQSLEVVAIFGLAGAGNSDLVAKLQEILAHRFIALDICSDATTSAYGANNGGEVAVVALGTGSVGMRLQLNEQGKLTQHLVGGWGFLIGDEGGGAKLGYHSVQALVAEFEYFGYAQSQLAKAVAAFINTQDSHVITRQAIAVWLANAKPIDFAQLSPLVTQHQSDCPVAKNIIDNHVASVESLIRDTRADTTLPVVLLGGLAQSTQTLLSATTKRLLVSAKGDALDGACLLATIAVKKHKLAI
ncbi:BadF/BadG/BcrA/BcrD ATPase family protein [Candidatus Colwellia aromaticivorans]|uniref:BadF/BadG/BcrA/BcrD ATPase family protein n=1 Tax=Candidatus Colwellia aromaticivorans TaxID=2267621 RepID=UPI000DF2BE2C|nr:BadF/BadG/BcrA/BcrD ATPase family protein [Candidatus Colwellia aromaticivorans]